MKRITPPIAALCLTLASCSNENPSTSTSPMVQTVSKTSRTLAGDAAVDAFETAYPDAAVELSAAKLATAIEFDAPVAWSGATSKTGVAMDFAQSWHNLFLPEGSSVRVSSAMADVPAQEARTVALEQLVNNVPVFGAEILVHFDSTAATMSSVSSTVARVPPMSVEPKLSDAQARQRARQEWERSEVGSGSSPEADETELMIFVPSMLGLEGQAVLAYRVDIGTFRVFVDANSGVILHRYRNAAFVAPRFFECGAATCQPAEPPTRGVETASLKVLTDAAYDYFKQVHGQDGYARSKQGADVGAYSGYWIKDAEYDPAARALRFSAGWVHRDIVAHEYTHGILYHDARLEYTLQPGAIHEFFADFFATLIDMGGSSPWVIGEGLTLPGQRVPLRDLRSPKQPGFNKDLDYNPMTNAGQPERLSELVLSTDAICRTVDKLQDNGCVHFNGAILSLAAVRAVDGPSPKQAGMGRAKFARIAFETMLHLPRLPLLTQAASGLRGSCDKFQRKKQFAMAASDCRVLDDALRSVGL